MSHTGPTIAHIGVAVADVAAAQRFYRDVLGVHTRGPEEADGARIVHLEFGGSDVELLEPLAPDTPIGKFLAKRGPGIMIAWWMLFFVNKSAVCVDCLVVFLLSGGMAASLCLVNYLS